MSNQKCIIVGASHAAAQLASTLRRKGWQGSITIIGNEHYLPYHRPPLSKTFLSGDKSIGDLQILSPIILKRLKIRFLLGVNVDHIDRETQRIILDEGESLSYTKLALTTGSQVRKLAIPGVELHGVYYLRGIHDVEQIRASTGKGKKAVIIGGGYIGLETAAVLRKLGMKVTVLEAAPRILERVTAPEISAFYMRVHKEEGVNIVTGAMAERIEGEKNVEKVVCADGQSHEADLVIIGVGIVPATKLAEQAGLELDNGIIVDEYARTSDPDILAAGDCTSHFNSIYNRNIRLESVQNATAQATVAANTICGELNPYNTLPWFWSDQYDIKLQIAGLSEGYDETVIRGSIETGRHFAVFYLKDQKLVAVDAVNSPQEFMFGKRLIADKSEPKKSRLADESIAMKEVIRV